MARRIHPRRQLAVARMHFLLACEQRAANKDRTLARAHEERCLALFKDVAAAGARARDGHVYAWA